MRGSNSLLDIGIFRRLITGLYWRFYGKIAQFRLSVDFYQPKINILFDCQTRGIVCSQTVKLIIYNCDYFRVTLLKMI